ncbi:spinocerebellar ataxia type 10 protein domain-containing protein [Mucor mucedo]|uniref:spinocerebellar ataxia type 10 protein domain-containing protein n=1 Tax=Mucor mucedo TaxID=29922 RepID=UPI0022209514|nr:spinocerebellar ataxia type 10 protein domain-containing protein [Mucor mucedo]KAI7887247.1 spinocerebellar ataxia type 10 protein domain-containing protein [Mucor mucedo]
MTSETDNNMILQVGTQAICNIITNNQIAIDFIWKIWMSNERRGSIWSLILSKSNENIIMSALVLIINCIRGNEIRCGLLVTSKIGKDIIAAILGDIERLHGSEESKNFELGYTIFSELISFGYFKELYTNIDDFSKNILISDHQTILLKLLDSKIHAHKESFPEFIGHKELEFLIDQFQVIAKETIVIILAVKGSNPEEKSNLEVEKVTNVYTGVILLLQMLNQLFVLDENHQRGIKQLLVGVNALSLVTDILGHLESMKLPPAQVENPLAGFNFLKRECVRLMGTLCHKDRLMQDKIRELGGIPLILCQFKIDDSNPYLREYATLALRNVMEGNTENQKLIEELQPQEILQTDELKEMGLSTELMQDGKVRIKKI